MSNMPAKHKAKRYARTGLGTADLVIDDLHGRSAAKRYREVMPPQGKPYPSGWPQEPKHPLLPTRGEQGGPHIATSEMACVSVSARLPMLGAGDGEGRVTGWVIFPGPKSPSVLRQEREVSCWMERQQRCREAQRYLGSTRGLI